MRANEDYRNQLPSVVNTNYEPIPILHDIEKEALATRSINTRPRNANIMWITPFRTFDDRNPPLEGILRLAVTAHDPGKHPFLKEFHYCYPNTTCSYPVYPC